MLNDDVEDWIENERNVEMFGAFGSNWSYSVDPLNLVQVFTQRPNPQI